jgi:lysophospholipid acyltransferase (LPLAT)-like uncharacterized protein
MDSAQKSQSRFVPHQPKWIHRVGALALYTFDRAITSTLRPIWADDSELFDPQKPVEPVIFCIWHNRLALAMWLYRMRPLKNRPHRRLAALVSASRDGAFLAAILEKFGVQPVRGSSSRRGPQALLELTRWAEQGYDLAITPDGPRGPRYSVQEGVIVLAQLTGLPIVPVSCWLSRKWTLNSWDRFQVPLPFSRCAINVGKVVRVPREASDAEREMLRAELETRMRSLTRD